MKKKLSILAVIIIIIGVVVVAIKGFNVNIENKAHQSISVPIGKEFNISDIKAISKEVFGKETVKISKAGSYQDVAIINVGEVSQDQIDQLKTKIEEKYDLKSEDKDTNKEETKSSSETTADNTETSDENAETADEENAEDTAETTAENSNKLELTVTDVPRITLFDMAKQYILFVGIATVIVLVYFTIRYKKLNSLKVLVQSIKSLLLVELLYMSIIAITRYPIDQLAIIAFIAIYVAVLTYLNSIFIKETSKK